MNLLVSIIIPAYNAQATIADTLRSALAQTWEKKEIIVVDDGSSDATVAVARQLASNAVAVVSRPHRGATAARNAGFSACQGDYVQWLDADDLLAPDKIAKQIEALRRCRSSRTLLSSAWGRFYHRVDKARFAPTPLWCDLSPSEFMVRKLAYGVCMQTGAWLVSRDLSEAAGPWNPRLLVDQDGEYFSRIIRESDEIVFVPAAKSYWRASALNSVSYVGRSAEKLAAQMVAMKLQIAQMRSLEDSPRARSACLAYLQWFYDYVYPEWPDLEREANELAAELGGRLNVPRLRWKYAWIQKLFGWRPAKRANLYLPRLRLAAAVKWDKAVFHLAARHRALEDLDRRRRSRADGPGGTL